MSMDDTELNLKCFGTFKARDWSECHPDAKESIPTNIPELRRKSLTTTWFADADYTGCQVTICSQTGIILWLSKQQSTVKSRTFDSESIAMKAATDLTKSLQSKLWMFGVPVEETTSVLCNKQVVVCNMTIPESTLTQLNNSVVFTQPLTRFTKFLTFFETAMSNCIIFANSTI